MADAPLNNTTPDKAQANPAPADLVHPPAPAGSHPPGPAPDELIFAGTVSLWLGFKTFVVGGLLLIAGIAGGIYGAMNSITPLIIAGSALFLASAIMLGYAVLRIKSQRYKITRRLIEREQGIVFRRTDALDLARVKDVELSQSLVQRMVGIGTIEVFSSDRTDPVLLIEAIPNPRPIYEKLRDAVIEISQRRGIVPLT